MKTETYESNAHRRTLVELAICHFENITMPNFFGATIKSIARATKNGSVWLWKIILKFGNWINKKWTEGAEIHNRALRESDRRYAHNFHHIRGVY